MPSRSDMDESSMGNMQAERQRDRDRDRKLPANCPIANVFRDNNICVRTENLRSNSQIYDDIYAYINISVCSFECFEIGLGLDENALQ